MFLQGEPVTKEQILRATFSANKELKNNPSKQTKTKETEEETESRPKKVTFADAPPGKGSPKSTCRRFSRKIRDAYEKMNMWYTVEDED